MGELLHGFGPRLLVCLVLLAGLAHGAAADTWPYAETYTYASDWGISGSIADANSRDGSFALYTVAGLAGSGFATAMMAFQVTVDHPMRLQVTYTIDYIGGCDTAHFGFSGLYANWRVDGQNAGEEALVSPFAWGSLLDKTAELIELMAKAGMKTGAFPTLRAGVEEFLNWMGVGTKVVDAFASAVETLSPKRETVSFSFEATGYHWVEVGVEAKTGAVGGNLLSTTGGPATAAAMALGVVSEVRIEPELVWVEVQGPPSVGENATADYSCIAGYSDGTHADVTEQASWSIDTSAASAGVDAGRLGVGRLDSDVVCTVAAEYTWKPTDQTSYTQSATRSVALEKAPSVSPAAPAVVGYYYDPLNPDNVLDIDADGTFYMVSTAYLGLNVGEEGTWRTAGETVTLSFSDGAMRGQVGDGVILFEPVPLVSMTTSVWIRRGKPGPSVTEVAGVYTPVEQGNGKLVLNGDHDQKTYELRQEDFLGQSRLETGRWNMNGFLVELRPDDTDLLEYSGIYAADFIYLPYGLFGLEMLVWSKSR